MFLKVLGIAAVIVACTGEPPAHQPRYSPGGAVSTQSFIRHDVPLSYKQTSTHPQFVAQAHQASPPAPPPHRASAPSVSYVTPVPAQYSTPLGHLQYPSAAQVQPQTLYTKVESPSENHPQAEFTQAYFLPKTYPQYQNSPSTYSGAQQSEGSVPQEQYYGAQRQYSAGPALFQPAVAPPQYQVVGQAQYQQQNYQVPQHPPAQYVSVSQGQQQEYAQPQYEVAYRVAAPSIEKGQQLDSENSLKSIEYQVANYNGYEPSNAPVIAKFSPAAFKAQSFAKSTPVFIQAVPASSSPYSSSGPSYTKSTQNYVQNSPNNSKPRYEEATQTSSNTVPYSEQTSGSQYLKSALSYGQTTQLYAVPSNSRPYYTQQH